MKLKFAKVIRILTNAPIFAAALCTLLYVCYDNAFANLWHYLGALGFLSVLPLLSYLVAWLVPPIHRKGRTGERNLAIVFSVLGYIGGFLMAVLGGGTVTELVLFGTYLLSGVLIAVTTLLHFKASGHACGCSGPIAMLSLFVSPWFLLCYFIMTPIVWASRQLKRHTAVQMVIGSLIPVIAMVACCLVFSPF